MEITTDCGTVNTDVVRILEMTIGDLIQLQFRDCFGNVRQVKMRMMGPSLEINDYASGSILRLSSGALGNIFHEGLISTENYGLKR